MNGGSDFDALCHLAAAIGAACRPRGWRLATAESCTGGLVSAALTSVAGASDWFDRGFVTYSNTAKSDLLGVNPALFAQVGAVSPEVASAMALGACRALVVESENGAQLGQFLPDLQAHSPAMGQKAGEKWTAAPHLQPTIPKSDRLLGARQRAGVEVAVAITGIAGPGGGTPEKPVGTVWFGLAWGAGDAVHSETRHALFKGDRGSVRLQAAEFALRWLLQAAQPT